MKNTTDLTVFAWQEPTPETRGLRGIFARSPSEFAHAKVGRDSDFGVSQLMNGRESFPGRV